MNARRLRTAAAIASAYLFLSLSPATADTDADGISATEDRIESIQLTIEWEAGEPATYIESEVTEAIEKTLRLAIINQLGASQSTLARNLDQVTATLRNVINIVLTRKGMELKKIELLPGTVTEVRMTIRLASEKIEDFNVHFRFRSSTPFMGSLTDEERVALRTQLAEKLKGTPFSDREWVERLVRRQVVSFFAENDAYSDFNLLTLVVPETTTEVYVTFIARDGSPSIARYFLKLRSQTMLNLQLADIEAVAGSHLEDLRTLPVSFVRAKAPTIEALIAGEVRNLPQLSIMRPEASAELYVVDEDASFVLWVDSRRWRTMLTGRVDLNREGDSARFDFTAGLRFGPSLDAFFHGTLLPGDLEFRPQLGIAAHGGKLGFVEAAYDFKMNSPLYRAQINPLPDFYVSGERYAKRRLRLEDEYSFTYIYRNAYEFKIISDLKGEVYGAVAVRI